MLGLNCVWDVYYIRCMKKVGHFWHCSLPLILGPAPEGITNKIYEVSKSLQEYHICPDLKVDISKIGKQTFEVDTFKPFTGTVQD